MAQHFLAQVTQGWSLTLDLADTRLSADEQRARAAVFKRVRLKSPEESNAEENSSNDAGNTSHPAQPSSKWNVFPRSVHGHAARAVGGPAKLRGAGPA